MKLFAATLALALAGTAALAQQHQPGMVHTPGMSHTAPQPAKPAAGHAGHDMAGGEGKLTETGQATFAAIQEAVAVLEADPNTDWSKVNIETLRRHLVDMENVLTMTNIETIDVPNGARFVVTGSGSVVPSIQRMVAGHASTMGTDDWKYVAANTANGATLEVTSPRAADAVKIKALNFAGLMARGSHHQPHHYGMATGKMVH